MAPRFLLIEKLLGETPLQAIERWRAANPAHSSLPATYAGRLDPMATGALLVLFGEECKRKERYQGLDKEYEVEVLLGIGTDSGDVLGVPALGAEISLPDDMAARTALSKERGAKTVPYPAFSSKPVDGTPLFAHALAGTLGSIEIPMHDETIYHITRLGMTSIDAPKLAKRIESILAHAPRANDPRKRLGADFRQDAIRAAWTELLAAHPGRTFPVLRIRVSCGSGTYMRSLAERIGASLGTRALALSIRRTRIGRRYSIAGLELWKAPHR